MDINYDKFIPFKNIKGYVPMDSAELIDWVSLTKGVMGAPSTIMEVGVETVLKIGWSWAQALEMFIQCLLILILLGYGSVSNEIVLIDSRDDETSDEASITPQWLKTHDAKKNPKAK
jgi:hypothetical protein